jgi:hypothetical protein
VATAEHGPGVAATQRDLAIVVAYRVRRLSSAIAPFKMISNPSECGDRQGNMGELIIRFVARTGIGRMSAEQSNRRHSNPPALYQ